MTLTAGILFAVYFFAGIWLFTRPFQQSAGGLSKYALVGFFAARVAAAVSVILISSLLFNAATDYHAFHAYGLSETEMLKTDPGKFFTDIFRSNYAERGEFFGSENSYWNDLRTNLIFKILGLLNLISAGNIYVNALLLTIPSFYANLLLWRVLRATGNTGIFQRCLCFLCPSVLYYSAGIHKDLFVFIGICIFIWALYFAANRRFSTKIIFALAFSFLLILLIRNFVAILLIPAVCAFWLSRKSYGFTQVARPYLIIFATVLVGVFACHIWVPRFDPLAVLAAKQQAFSSLGNANTSYPDTVQLNGSPANAAGALPVAIRHSMLSPLPGEFAGELNLLFFFELVLLYSGLLWFLWMQKKQPCRPDFNLALFLISFSFPLLCCIGLITGAAGALVRYRSLPLMLFILGLTMMRKEKRY